MRNLDNEATNRLIDALSGFDRINQTIYKYTKSNLTQLNRYMLGGGKQNITNPRGLTKGMVAIYTAGDYISKDMLESMENSSSKRKKLLKNINPDYITYNKTGELITIENDLAL